MFSMNAIEMPTAVIPLEVTTAAVVLAMREMDSTAQVKPLCVGYCMLHYVKICANVLL